MDSFSTGQEKRCRGDCVFKNEDRQRSPAHRFDPGGQISPDLNALNNADPDTDVFLMEEVLEEATYVPHNKKKIAFIFSVMHHFAEELGTAGWRVSYA